MDRIILNIIILIFLGMIIFYLTSQDCNSIDEFTNKIQENLNNVQKSIVANPQQITSNTPQKLQVFQQQNIPVVQDTPNTPDSYVNQDYNSNPLIKYTGVEANLIDKADFNNAFTLQTDDKNNIIDFNKYNIDKYNVKDYLPKDIHNDWFDVDFSQARHNIDDNNLINPDRFCIGINTVGQSLKNPSWDIRGSVPCPKYSISPWNNSTFEPDYNLKPLC
jgi:hypothetical protein